MYMKCSDWRKVFRLERSLKESQCEEESHRRIRKLKKICGGFLASERGLRFPREPGKEWERAGSGITQPGATRAGAKGTRCQLQRRSEEARRAESRAVEPHADHAPQRRAAWSPWPPEPAVLAPGVDGSGSIPLHPMGQSSFCFMRLALLKGQGRVPG